MICKDGRFILSISGVNTGRNHGDTDIPKKLPLLLNVSALNSPLSSMHVELYIYIYIYIYIYVLYMLIAEEAMSTADLIFAGVSSTQITRESSGSLCPDDKFKYLLKQYL